MRIFLASLGLFLVSGITPAFAKTSVEPSPDLFVAPGTRNVLMLSYPLRKGCYSPAVITMMTLLYEGDSPANIRRVYAKVGDKILTTKRAISKENYTVTLWFDKNNAPGLCYSGAIDVYADFSGAAKKHSMNRLRVELGTDVISTDGSVGEPTAGWWVAVANKKK